MASRPVILFIVPPKYNLAYAAIMNKLSVEMLTSIGRDPADVELVGFISPNAQYGTACLSFVNRSGVDPHNVLALVLFGEAGDQFSFRSSETDDYVRGSVIIPDSLVSYPTLCIPSLETGWLTDPPHWERIRDGYADLLQNGRKRRLDDEGYTFITRDKVNWN